MPGGLSELKSTDDEVQLIVDEIKKIFFTKFYNSETFDVDSYKTQVVNGTNYFIKVKTDKEHVHLRVHQSLPCNSSKITYVNQQLGKTKTDEIIYF